MNADTVSNADTQAVTATDTTQNDKQVQLTASSTDQAKTDDTAKADTVSSTAEKVQCQQLLVVTLSQNITKWGVKPK
ncbi:hypothetical protein ACG92U_12235 [Leuconostoc citreum]